MDRRFQLRELTWLRVAGCDSWVVSCGRELRVVASVAAATEGGVRADVGAFAIADAGADICSRRFDRGIPLTLARARTHLAVSASA